MDKTPPLVFHADWYDIIDSLPSERQLEVYRGIMAYAFRGQEPTDVFVAGVTALMRKFIDDARDKYADVRKRRRDAATRRWSATSDDRCKCMQMDANASTCMQKDANDAITITNTNTITNTITNTMSSPNINISPTPRDARARDTPARSPSEAKVHFGTDVTMTSGEYDALVSRHGKEAAEWCINKLDNYKASSGKKYRSDYRAILNWVITEFYKNGTSSTNRLPDQPTAKQQRDREFAGYIASNLSGGGSPPK